MFIQHVLFDSLFVLAVFKYDTVHGVYDGTVENDDSNLIVDGKKIKVRSIHQTHIRLIIFNRSFLFDIIFNFSSTFLRKKNYVLLCTAVCCTLYFVYNTSCCWPSYFPLIVALKSVVSTKCIYAYTCILVRLRKNEASMMLCTKYSTVVVNKRSTKASSHARVVRP